MVWHNLKIPWTKRKRCCWYLISFLVSSFIFCDSYALSYLTLIIQHARFSQLFGLATQLNIIIHLLMHAYKYIEFVCVSHKIQLYIYMRITHTLCMTWRRIIGTIFWCEWMNHCSYFMKNLRTLCELHLKSKPLNSIKI